jgi:hypothetical protein
MPLQHFKCRSSKECRVGKTLLNNGGKISTESIDDLVSGTKNANFPDAPLGEMVHPSSEFSV